MKKIVAIIGCALILAACHSLDKTALEPATLEVIIDKVGATKLSFSVKTSDQDAAYIHLGVGEWEDYWYPLTDQQIAEDYLKQLIEIDDSDDIDHGTISSFQDQFCFKGDRSFRSQFLGSDMDYRMIVFQVDPFKREIIGNAVSTPFHTQSQPAVDLDWKVEVDGDVLTIIPTDNDVPYYWDYESIGYYWGDLLSSVYFYLYEVTDMYEEYDFIDQVLSKGPQTYVFSENDEGMVEGDIIVVSAVTYANHELAGTPKIWEFEYHKNQGKTTLRAAGAPEAKAPVPLRPSLSRERPLRRSR